MKIGYKFFLFTFFLLIFPSSISFSFEGPLQIKNQYPIFFHAIQPYLEKTSAENSFSLSLSHSSTYTVQSSGNWIINLDMEITELNFRYKRSVKDIVELGVDVPILVFGGVLWMGFLGYTMIPLGSPIAEEMKDH